MKIDRQQVLDKYNCKCGYCGTNITLKTMQIDHIFPKHSEHILHKLHTDSKNTEQYKWYLDYYSLIPSNINHIDNLMPTCRYCNNYKSGETLNNFRESLKKLHERYFKCLGFKKMAIAYGIIIETGNTFDGKFYFEKL